MDRPAQMDLETLRTVVPALERLEGQWNDARVSVAARGRGYFTPDEEDRVRQMLLAYRNYRFALYEIIYRGYEYPRIQEPERQLMVFLLAFGAALTIYAKSLKLIQAYEREPLVRKKLNEPDVKFELEAGLLRGGAARLQFAGELPRPGQSCLVLAPQPSRHPETRGGVTAGLEVAAGTDPAPARPGAQTAVARSGLPLAL